MEHLEVKLKEKLKDVKNKEAEDVKNGKKKRKRIRKKKGKKTKWLMMKMLMIL